VSLPLTMNAELWKRRCRIVSREVAFPRSGIIPCQTLGLALIDNSCQKSVAAWCWPGLSCFFFPFRNRGCPALAFVATAGTIPPVPVCYAQRAASDLRRSSPALYHYLVLPAIAFSTHREPSGQHRENALIHSGTPGRSRDPSTPFVARSAHDKFRSG
jgi:hypothetical protein